MYEIREVLDDCSDLLAVRRLWFPESDDDFESEFRAWWKREREQRRAFVAYTSATPIGMANGQVFSRMPAAGRPRARWMYAANVYVAEEHRRQGVARDLMRALIDLAQAEGMLRIVLAPSDMSIPLYESLGFRTANDLMRLDFAAPA